MLTRILNGDIQLLNKNAYSKREGHTPVAIIIHGTASGGWTNAVNVAGYFASTEGTDNPVSAHYIIDKDGTVVRCNDLGDGAWANGILEAGHDPIWDTLLHPQINPNNVTISIEHVKFDKFNADQITNAQKHASFQLVAALCETFSIPPLMLDATGGITGHFSISPQSRTDCPSFYPFQELISFLQGEVIMIPKGWQDDGTTLTAPNGHTVIQGFRDFLLHHAWDADNWPLEEEHEQTPLELSNPDLGNGTQQVFRWAVLEWRPVDNRVFVGWIGQELLKLRTLLASPPPANS